MFDDYVTRAVLAGVGAVIVAGPLGCFVVWRRMAYFGDTLSHTALTGVALGLLLGVNLVVGVVVTGVVIGLALIAVQDRARLAGDTVLGILAHSALAIGLIVVSQLDGVRLDLMGYLFGDILAVNTTDLAVIYGGAIVVLAALAWIWTPLVAGTVSPDLARAEGVPAARARIVFIVLIALTVAMAMKVIGVLLITALLLIPPAAARRFSGNPEAMAALSVVAGLAAVGLGIAASFAWNTPTGPSIVAAAAALFAVTLAMPRRA
ncbi:MAG: metal ABC transporter permease [Rhodospirillaceae bacterium]|nr:metal ABC transporter permease [Rhodospirillaceae bacterium]